MNNTSNTDESGVQDYGSNNNYFGANHNEYDEEEESGSSLSVSWKGVLYKRRDVFQNQWRPRYFQLENDILTYHLLQSSSQHLYPNITASWVTPSPSAASSSPSPLSIQTTTPANNNSIQGQHDENRSAAMSTSVGDNSTTFNHQLLPRGTIYLRNCQVRRQLSSSSSSSSSSRSNHQRLQSQDGTHVLHVIVITPNTSSSSTTPPLYLATTQLQECNNWMRQFQRAAVAQYQQQLSIATTITTPSPSLVSLNQHFRQQERANSIPTTVATHRNSSTGLIPPAHPPRRHSDYNIASSTSLLPPRHNIMMEQSKYAASCSSLQPPPRPQQGGETTTTPAGAVSTDNPSIPTRTSKSQPKIEWKTIGDEAVILEGLSDELKQRVQHLVHTYVPLCLHHDDATNDGENPWNLLVKAPAGDLSRGNIAVTSFTRKMKHAVPSSLSPPPTGSETTETAAASSSSPPTTPTSTNNTFSSTILKSFATFPNDSPDKIFSVLADVRQRKQFENNVSHDARLAKCNDHVFLDYYAYHPIWPTSARDFLVAVHWRLLEITTTTQDQQEPLIEHGILVGAISHPAANHLMPTPANVVRGQLFVSLFLLRPDTNGSGCKATRLLSFDLCGTIPSRLTSSIIQQAGLFPRAVAKHLVSLPPISTMTNENEWTNRWLVQHIIDKLPATTGVIDKPGGRISITSNDDGESALSTVQQDVVAVDDENGMATNVIDDNPPSPNSTSFDTTTTINTTTSDEDVRSDSFLQDVSPAVLLLLTPLLLWHLTERLETWVPFNKEWVFLISAYGCLRTLVLHNLGNGRRQSSCGSTGTTISVRFNINLKGALAFLAKHKTNGTTTTNKTELPPTDLSIVHIVIKALGQVLDEMKSMNDIVVDLPFWNIHGRCFPRPRVDISLLHHSNSTNTAAALDTFVDCPSCSLDDLALSARSSPKEGTTTSWWLEDNLILGPLLSSKSILEQGASALVVFSPERSNNTDDDDDEGVSAVATASGSIAMHVAAPVGDQYNIVATIGTIRLPDKQLPPRSKRNKRKTIPQMSMSLSFWTHDSLSNVSQYRRFTERLQCLVEKPEEWIK